MGKRNAENKKGSAKLDNPKHELFCWLYAGHHNRDLFGNATRCYMHAFGKNDEVHKIRNEIEKLLRDREKGYTSDVAQKEARIKSIEHVARNEGAKLMAKHGIRERCDHLMDQLLSNDFMDRELGFAAGQRFDLNAKVAAIREWNRMKDRASDRLEGEFTFRWEDPAGAPANPKK